MNDSVRGGRIQREKKDRKFLVVGGVWGGNNEQWVSEKNWGSGLYLYTSSLSVEN